MPSTLVLSSLPDLHSFRRRLDSVDRPLKQIGALLTAQAQRAFTEQKLGTFDWPKRYPGQTEPFVNVAGLVSDFNRGLASPPSRRFERRPAGMDTGVLAGSISFRVAADRVQVGTNVPYGADLQWGLPSRQLVTESAKLLLADWLKTAEGKPYRQKVGFLFQTDELETQVAQRPFLGITDEGERDIREVVETWAAGEVLR